jgi:SAM-dependent methyltransferase
MGMNQTNPDFNDSLEKYFRRRLLPSAAGRAIELLERARVALFGGHRMMNERIIEYPMIFRLIRAGGCVLDVGCVSSRLPLHLASLGYEVHGADLRPYPMSHPAFTFHQVDLLADSIPFAAESFDVVTAVSCIEHFGLGSYGDLEEPEGDRRFLGVLRSLLKPGGQLLLTCPFGKAGLTPKQRIYDAASLTRLVEEFTVREEHYFRRVEGWWVPSAKASLADVESPSLPVNGVAVLDCLKG